jgi:light-regulated signal transduction histidine kinase (bacteriophytochrome)
MATTQGKYTVCLLRDVTDHHRQERELRRQAEELVRSNMELEQFAYVASHDLQEPLRIVSGYCQLLKRRYAGKLDEDADKFINYAVEGSVRLQELINDLLAYSRVSTKAKPFAEVKLSDVAAQAMANLQMAINERGAEVRVDPLPVIMGDPYQLLQLFQNLIGNAVKFCSETSPKVWVSAVRDQDVWTISVKDNGIGIEPKHFEKIFTIFQRLHSREKYEGTGIGLAICKKVVQRHGGSIVVESEPGQGATFKFTLPAMDH